MLKKAQNGQKNMTHDSVNISFKLLYLKIYSETVNRS